MPRYAQPVVSAQIPGLLVVGALAVGIVVWTLVLERRRKDQRSSGDDTGSSVGPGGAPGDSGGFESDHDGGPQPS
ncbi:hypothetical protein WEI85_45165 [Actinomycetes bacterium KLBMP 9797]